MVDYFAVVLNGLFTGIGVILAKEIWDVYKKYQERVKKELKETITRQENGVNKKNKS